MTTVRRRLRLWAAAWLLCHAASLFALVPRDCCAAHRPAARQADHGCHEKAAATHYPMRAANGTSCPMHRSSQSDRDEDSNRACAMRGTCDDPIAAMVALLSHCGVLTNSIETISPDLHVSAAAIRTGEPAIGRLPSPDPPPPRA